MHGLCCISLLAILLMGATFAQAAPVLYVYEFVMKAGDDRAWSDPAFDDSTWEPVHFFAAPQPDSILWFRGEFEIEAGHLVAGRPVGLYVAALASHQIWWDGELLGQGGVVGATPDAEEPGPIETHYGVPDRLATPGVHTLALRTSAFHRHFEPVSGYWTVAVGEYDGIAAGGGPQIRVALISLSGILMMAIFSTLMFLQNRRDKSFLFLGILCVVAALLLMAESYRGLFGYTYNWHLLRLSLVTGLSWLLNGMLLIFLARRFPMGGARWFVVAGVIAATLPIFTSKSWDPKAVLGFNAVFLLSAAWCVRAVWNRLPGSLLALVGVAFCLAALLLEPQQFLERNLYLALDLLLVCLLASHVLQVGQERRQREEAVLKSARLEIELLKKHIQPHFLMNTLTALSEWIEQEPRTAGKMIQSLSEEFRVLSDISNQSLIRMEAEIRLCRSHLEIMSHRRRRTYTMETQGIDPDAAIPPAVIHTLVENAITHDRNGARQVQFRLSEERREDRRCYVFESPLASGADPVESEGTGLRYIKARLEESFGSNWSLRSGPTASSWRTEILVPA